VNPVLPLLVVIQAGEGTLSKATAPDRQTASRTQPEKEVDRIRNKVARFNRVAQSTSRDAIDRATASRNIVDGQVPQGEGGRRRSGLGDRVSVGRRALAVRPAGREIRNRQVHGNLRPV
jgi:hypothetical protein